MKSLQVLECTLRDGGHHTQWNFDPKLLQMYFETIKSSGITYCEIGYRKLQNHHEVFGPWAYCREKFLKEQNIPASLSLAVMIDLKDYLSSDSEINLSALDLNFVQASESQIKLVRIAAHYHHYFRITEMSRYFKNLGYEVGVNLMRSGNTDHNTMMNVIHHLTNTGTSYIDVLTFADSFGAMTPDSSRELIKTTRALWPKLLGFHAHDNRGEALKNSLAAMEAGCDVIDSTTCGMGKGPGNTASELLLIELSKMGFTHFKHQAFRELLKVYFLPLKKEIGWGSDYFYYMAAEKGIHPDQVPEFIQTEKNYE